MWRLLRGRALRVAARGRPPVLLRGGVSSYQINAAPPNGQRCFNAAASGGSSRRFLVTPINLAAATSCSLAAVAAAQWSGPASCDAATSLTAQLDKSVTVAKSENELRPVSKQLTPRQFSLWIELRVLVLENLVWIVVSCGALVLATLFQTQNVGRLTAELTVKVLKFDAAAADSVMRRKELLSTLWQMVYWQSAVQALNFVGGALNRIVARRITRGLQLTMYEELLRCDIGLFDATKTGELTKCVEERVGQLAGVVQSVCRGIPSLVGVPLTLWNMWLTSPELARANGGMITGTVTALFLVYYIGIKQLSKKISKQKALATSAVTESFFAVRTVHAFDAAEAMVRR